MTGSQMEFFKIGMPQIGSQMGLPRLAPTLGYL